MDHLYHNQDKLPVLTEIVSRDARATEATGQGVANLQLAIIDADPRGYDPYNNAPPVPADNGAAQQ